MKLDKDKKLITVVITVAIVLLSVITTTVSLKYTGTTNTDTDIAVPIKELSVEREYAAINKLVGTQRVINMSEIIPESTNTKYVFIGDSRFVGMYDSVQFDDDFICIAKVGAGYEWFMSVAIPELEEVVSSSVDVDNWVIVFGLGVNDTYNVDKYIDTLKSLSEGYEVYALSVNPVGSESENVSNKDIQGFNSRVSSEEFNYIDSYSYLQEVGFDSRDGVHYSSDTYCIIYDYIVGELGILSE